MVFPETTGKIFEIVNIEVVDIEVVSIQIFVSAYNVREIANLIHVQQLLTLRPTADFHCKSFLVRW